jgi:polyketide synthase PksL
VLAFLRATLAELLLITGAEIATQASFADLGLDSIIGVEFIKHVNRHYGIKVRSSSLYTHPDLESYSRYLQEVLNEGVESSGQAEIEKFVSSLSGEQLERELNRQLEAIASN